jgi:hypothetical protein
MQRSAGVRLGIPSSLLLGLAVGCKQDTPIRSAATVGDSAGVEIVFSGDAVLSPSARWSLSPEPTLQVGTMEGAPEFQLHRVRAGLILNRDLLAIVNGGSQEVRFYGPEGSFLGARALTAKGRANTGDFNPSSDFQGTPFSHGTGR